MRQREGNMRAGGAACPLRSADLLADIRSTQRKSPGTSSRAASALSATGFTPVDTGLCTTAASQALTAHSAEAFFHRDKLGSGRCLTPAVDLESAEAITDSYPHVEDDSGRTPSGSPWRHRRFGRFTHTASSIRCFRIVRKKSASRRAAFQNQLDY